MPFGFTLTGKEHRHTGSLCADRSASPWVASLSACPQIASSGKGSAGHFCGELLRLRVHANATDIPYKSVAQIQADFHGGQVNLGFVDMVSGTPKVEAGRVKAIVSCLWRSSSLPAVNSVEDGDIDLMGRRRASGVCALRQAYARRSLTSSPPRRVPLWTCPISKHACWSWAVKRRSCQVTSSRQ